jgi:uncharacterized protein (TIGR00725 family)
VRPTIGVMGSGTSEHDDLARPVGELIASLGANLLTGGGPGVMRAVSRAFAGSRADRGISIGIVPCASEADRATPKEGYPNEFVELPIYTHLPYSGEFGTHDLSRNHINILSCAAIIALPGELGTAAEVSLALRYGKPIVAFGARKMFPRLPETIRVVGDIGELERFLRGELESGAA